MDAKLERQLKQAGIPESLWDGITVDGKRIAEVKSKAEKVWLPKGMNKTEAAWARELDYLVSTGKIKCYLWEPFRLRLTQPDQQTHRASYYVPDFLVWHLDGSLAIVEVKGFLRDDAARAFDFAAACFPMFRFSMVRKVKDGWETIRGEEWPL